MLLKSSDQLAGGHAETAKLQNELVEVIE